jgi:O-antigen/teichoic acid export membrane protein
VTGRGEIELQTGMGLRHMSIIAKVRERLGEPLLRNSVFIMVGTASSSLLAFIFWVVVARLYTATDVGLAGALVAAMGLVAAFSTLGFHIGVIRFLPLVEDKRGIINSCFILVGACSILASAIFIAGIPIWSKDLLFIRQDAVLLLGFILFVTATVLFRLQGNIFIGSRRPEFSSATQAGAAALKLPLVIVLVSLGAFGIFSSWGIAAAMMFILGLYFLVKTQPGYLPSLSFSGKVVKRMFQFSFVNYVSEVFGNVPMYILPLMVLGVLGAEQNAYYYIAYGVSGVLGVVPGAVLQSLFAEGSTEPGAIRATSIKAIKIMFLFLLMALLVALFLGDKILLLFGRQYSENSLMLLVLLAAGFIPNIVNEVYLTICMVRFKLRAILLVNLARGLLIPSLTYLLMVRFGLPGVGWGYLIALGSIGLVTGILLRNELGRKEIIDDRHRE